jgi:hypothetical protein
MFTGVDSGHRGRLLARVCHRPTGASTSFAAVIEVRDGRMIGETLTTTSTHLRDGSHHRGPRAAADGIRRVVALVQHLTLRTQSAGRRTERLRRRNSNGDYPDTLRRSHGRKTAAATPAPLPPEREAGYR